MAEAQWFVAHTYSGYENKVKVDIEKTIENRGLQDQILEVTVPMETILEVKNGVEKSSDKKLFPGYVLIHMYMNDETWYVIRNTRGVTGFVGPGSKPVPLSAAVMDKMLSGIRTSVEADIEVGDWVKIVTGSFKDQEGEVIEVDLDERLVTININSMGRDMPVEISFTDIKKI